MKQELADQIYNKCPRLFKQHKCIECNDGWFNLILKASTVIEDHLNNLSPEIGEMIYATQLKEKFGTLRFYVSHSTGFIEGVIELAEYLSHEICESCGEPGKQRNGGWIKTYCDDCAEKNNKV